MRIPIPPHLQAVLGYARGLREHQRFWEELTAEEREAFLEALGPDYKTARQYRIERVERHNRLGIQGSGPFGPIRSLGGP